MAAPIPLEAPVTTAVRRIMATILPARMSGASSGWHTEGPMGQHVDAAGPAERTPDRAGLRARGWGRLGGHSTSSTPTAALAKALLWGGGVLLTVALFAIGMMLVKSDVLPLRVFVALALPTLVWGVFALVRDSVSNERARGRGLRRLRRAAVGRCSWPAPRRPAGPPSDDSAANCSPFSGITGHSVRLDRVWARSVRGKG